MANYYVIQIKFHWGFSHVTHYMKHSLVGTRRVISSIITRNFFVTRNKQPMTIGTNRICISRDDNIVSTPCAFHDNSRQLQENSLWRFAFVAFFEVCDTSCPIYKVPFSFLLLSMPQLSKYVSIRPNERFRKVLQSWRSRYTCSWRRHNLLAAILRPSAKRLQFKLYERHLAKEDPSEY